MNDSAVWRNFCLRHESVKKASQFKWCRTKCLRLGNRWRKSELSRQFLSSWESRRSFVTNFHKFRFHRFQFKLFSFHNLLLCISNFPSDWFNECEKLAHENIFWRILSLKLSEFQLHFQKLKFFSSDLERELYHRIQFRLTAALQHVPSSRYSFRKEIHWKSLCWALTSHFRNILSRKLHCSVFCKRRFHGRIKLSFVILCSTSGCCWLL